MSIGSHTFLNPNFTDRHKRSEYIKDHPVSELGYTALSLLKSARFALENETSGVPLDERGVGCTLEVAEHIVQDLIERAEFMERDAKGAA